MALNKDLVDKISEMPTAVLSFIDENDLIFAVPIKDFVVTADYITLKKPKSLTHKFGQDQKVGICWPDFQINENTGKLGPFEHYTFWGTANENAEDEIRVILSPKFHSQTKESTFDPSAEEEIINKARQFRAQYGLNNAYETKGVV
jgi:hypothetical protein